MIIALVASLCLVALLLVLGRWRVRLRKASHEQSVRAAWYALSATAKMRLLASGDFTAGLKNASTRFKATAAQAARGESADQIFDAYLGELRRSDNGVSTQEWRDALAQVGRWVASAQ